MSIHKDMKRITVPSILRMKEHGEKITVLTAYDALMAQILDESGIDIVLVGDSGGMVMGGHENTIAVTMEEMLVYTRSVRRGVNRALLVADMPFLSYRTGINNAVKNAGLLLQEGGAEAVKLEGGEPVIEIVSKLVDFGIPVMGHLGLTPQSINKFGSYRLQGKNEGDEERYIKEAKLLQDAGAFSIVLEKIPAALAAKITESVHIPTIGIGAGIHCDGQVVVTHDMLGLYDKFKPKFVRRYAELGNKMMEAFINYIDDVKSNKFPSEDESY
jgi:3-methyl-2-oxobutanoate hydroxymethyltransferase